MSLASKYKSGCGCNVTYTPRRYGLTGAGCCGDPIQAPPTPCCPTTSQTCMFGGCLLPTCNVVASVEPFYISFSNLCAELPLDGNYFYFFHPATKLLQVIGFDGVSYRVQLVDPTYAGGVIRKGDCVYPTVVPASISSSGTQRCLSGIFTAPAENADETIYIFNGSGIPQGATITFTAEGQTGSYVVLSYISASGNTYAYSVQNTGSGFTPGLQIQGDCNGVCNIPIEVITEVDLCGLSVTSLADSLTACLNGSPRAFSPTGEGDTLYGNADGQWELRKVTNTDCCVTIDGCLKFSGDVCPSQTDSVALKDINLDCFEAAWAEVVLANPEPDLGGQTNMPMNINGYPVVVTAYDSGTHVITLAPVEDLDGEILQWPEGTQICLGECCASCLNGPKITDYASTDGNRASTFRVYADNNIEWDSSTPKFYLIGFDTSNPLTSTVLELDTSYDDTPGRPLITDPLVIREKFCNNSETGCDQTLELDFNFELAFDPVPAGVRVHFEVAHYQNSSLNLADDTTPNPFTTPVSLYPAKFAGYIDGPSNLDANDYIQETHIGIESLVGNNKVLPAIAGSIRDFAYLEKCNCIQSVIWLYVSTEVIDDTSGTGTMNGVFTIRRRVKFDNAHGVALPANRASSQGWNT